MKQRNPLYEAVADVLIDTNANDLEEVVVKIKTDYAKLNGQFWY